MPPYDYSSNNLFFVDYFQILLDFMNGRGFRLGEGDEIKFYRGGIHQRSRLDQLLVFGFGGVILILHQLEFGLSRVRVVLRLTELSHGRQRRMLLIEIHAGYDVVISVFDSILRRPHMYLILILIAWLTTKDPSRSRSKCRSSLWTSV